MPVARSRFTSAVSAGSSGSFDPRHFDGVIGFRSKAVLDIAAAPEAVSAPELLRPLLEYERLVAGRW
jgi:hypothetical protein